MGSEAPMGAFKGKVDCVSPMREGACDSVHKSSRGHRGNATPTGDIMTPRGWGGPMTRGRDSLLKGGKMNQRGEDGG